MKANKPTKCDNCDYNMCEDCPEWHKEDLEDEETED